MVTSDPRTAVTPLPAAVVSPWSRPAPTVRAQMVISASRTMLSYFVPERGKIRGAASSQPAAVR